MRETTIGKKLLPLVQLLPAVVVCAAVLVTLPHTGPVLAAVPEKLPEPAVTAAASEAAASEPQAPEEDLAAKLPYADGIYTGSSRGYGGKVQVQVTMEDGAITDVQITDARHETKSFLKRARRLLSMILDAQTWEVDAISEATYTSRGILGAVKNALTGEAVNNPLPPQPKPAEPLVEEEFTAPSAYRDGVYTASAPGFGGPVEVQVTITGGVIADIAVGSHDGETTSYFSKARRVISTILETGTPEGVDAVSGATYSSTGLLNAVKLALAKAANEPVPTEELQAEAPAESAPEETEVAAPTVEVAQPEPRQETFWDQLQDAWYTLFPEQAASSAAVSSPEFFAPAPAESEAAADPEAQPAESAASEPEQPSETEGQAE